ncbi:GGDEF domain-containing protein [Pseudaquabacterium pictum]|uniref:diguanylate cyclase n=1 Tax=Pseudaquabacterium pictum TaxID=2315236 RepID=A0A480AUS8_9BURK|nr:GGDEF domain-containing protein [Rubrivivax pictus]GCL65439.1 GGDEF domain-containing protein [Rubrivivax pictus]
MDPSTVILILALNLIAIGGLLAMIGRRMDDAAGMRGFATGSLVFGLAYLLRLALGHASTSLAAVLPDAAMVYATLCYATGLRQFGGRPPLGQRAIAGWTLGFATLSLACTLAWQDVGRHAVLNAGLAHNYLWLSVLATLGTRRVIGTMRWPLTVLAVITGMLGLLTAVRAVAAVSLGVQPLFNGLPAQIYYGYATITTVLLGPNLLWMVFVQLNDRLARLATHDPLTGLLNRNGLDAALDRHFGSRPAQALVLCQIDIDHFKQINDSHGHAAGDAVLQGVAGTLAAHVRGGDFVARLGGEEFLVGCCGAGLAQDQALALAERLRDALAAQSHPLAGGTSLRCTVSIGVSPAIVARSGWEAALRAADAALYQAKHAGRNRVVVAAPSV